MKDLITDPILKLDDEGDFDEDDSFDDEEDDGFDDE